MVVWQGFLKQVTRLLYSLHGGKFLLTLGSTCVVTITALLGCIVSTIQVLPWLLNKARTTTNTCDVNVVMTVIVSNCN